MPTIARQPGQAIAARLKTAMMHDNPTAATGWLNLARLNDYALVMTSCHGTNGTLTPDGRHACLAPLWLDDEKAATPPAKAGK